MGRASRKNKQPNSTRYVPTMYPGVEQEVDTPQGKHTFRMLPSYAMYWIQPNGWRRVK